MFSIQTFTVFYIFWFNLFFRLLPIKASKFQAWGWGRSWLYLSVMEVPVKTLFDVGNIFNGGNRPHGDLLQFFNIWHGSHRESMRIHFYFFKSDNFQGLSEQKFNFKSDLLKVGRICFLFFVYVLTWRAVSITDSLNWMTERL